MFRASRPSFSSQSDFSSFYNSMRHERIFDIIELLRRFIIELQMKLLCMYFKDWVLKLLICITWRLNNVLTSVLDFYRQSRRFFYFICWTLTHQKLFFWKNILGPPCIFNKIKKNLLFDVRQYRVYQYLLLL